MKKQCKSIMPAAAAIMGLLLAGTSATAQAAAAKAGRNAAVIKRDDFGIPHIFADDIYSLYYGWGYAVAEDRLFQLESVRYTSQGRAAEVFGKEYLKRDQAILINYDPNTLKPQLAALKGDHRQAMDGMVAGINKRIDEVMADKAHLLPKQFTDFGFEPQHWTDLDVAMAWVGMFMFGFTDASSQVSNLAFFEELKAKHGAETAEKIFASMRWKYDPTAPSTVEKTKPNARTTPLIGPPSPVKKAELAPLSEHAGLDEEEQTIALFQGSGPDLTPKASNAWVANRSKLADADAVLFSGPQVGDRVPSMIWSVSIHGAGLDITGLTYPGVPYIHYGTNGDIAWGRTSLAGSIIDIYQEQLNPANPRQYRYQGKWRDMEKRDLTFRVKGEAEPVKLTTYNSVHGPVLTFDEKNNAAYSKKRSWAGNEMETMFAFYDVMKARSHAEWSAAISHKAHNQNQFYADKYGNIAYIQAGKYPVRPDGFNIQVPTVGDGTREWRGIQPFAENARVTNPPQGWITSWNNRPGSDMQNTDTYLWSKLNRVDNIIERLEAKPKLTVQEVWDINRYTSVASEYHRYFVPLLREAVKDLPADDRIRMVADTITNWDGLQTDTTFSGYYSSPGYAAFYGWLGNALTAAFSQDMPERYMKGCGAQSASYNCPYGQPASASVLYFALTKGTTGSPVNAFDFLHGKATGVFIRETLAAADKELTAKYGPDIAAWLDVTRKKVWTNMSGMDVPWAGVEEKITYGLGQNRGTMNSIVVFRNGNVTLCDSAPPGQSGFIAPDGKRDPHYSDQQLLYTSFSCKPRAITPADIEVHKTSEKRLTF